MELNIIRRDGPVKGYNEHEGAMFLKVCIEGEVYEGMVDTGASDCFLSQRVRDAIPSEAIWDIIKEAGRSVRVGDQSKVLITETVRLKCSFDGVVVYYNFHVMDKLAHPIIIGRDLLRDLQAEIITAEHKVVLFMGNPVSSIKGEHILPWEEKIIQVAPWKEIKEKEGETVILEPSQLSVAGVDYAINYTNKQWWLKVANLTGSVIYLDKNDVIAYAKTTKVEQLDRAGLCAVLEVLKKNVENDQGGAELYNMKLMEKEEIMRERQQKRERILDMDLGETCMSGIEQDSFREMLARNMETIAFSMQELGHCTWAPMKIRMKGDQGVCATRPYRYSPQKMDIIDEQIRELLKLGIIEPSNSAWRSPLVVVEKKDGKARLCTDYRVLNLMTQDDNYPMPTARSLFLYMAYRKPTIFTAMDLLSGYHQCDLHPDSREYSAFESPSGVWQWTRMPFGMKQSPWQFTKIMSLALGGLMPRTCLAYLDDIIIFDPDVESHISNVEKVLQALQKAGLTVKPAKCEWGRSEIRFLGHIITPEGLKTQPKVTQKVQEFGRPIDKHTVRSFLGLCNYYRNFIPNFAVTAVPLNRLLKNGVPFDWSETCEEAFKSIQGRLTAPPLLIHPEIGGHFYVLTDASDGACGAAICHMREGLMRPIVYYGYTFGTSEVNYTISEREGLAVVKTLKAYEDMMSGGKITIVTDHQPLIPLLQQAHKAPSKRLKRWALALTAFDYEIIYNPGKDHWLPDFISRVPMKGGNEVGESDEEFEPEVGCELLELVMDGDEISTEDLKQGQWEDKEYKVILEYMVNNELPDDWAEAKVVLIKAETMGVDKDGVLCKFEDIRKRKQGKGPADLKPRIVIPAAMVKRVLYLLHDDILCGGHVGITALHHKIVEKFYWKNLYMDVMQYVRTCERCALRKRGTHYKAMAKSWDRPDYPWQVVQTDFIGPLRKTKDGYLYIMTFIDLLTGWPEAFPTKNTTAATAATIFLQNIVCRYGKIQVLNSDRGPSYIAKLFKEITSRLTCKQRFTSSRNPQGNARAERLHKTLAEMIGCYITENHEAWPEILPIALWAVRSTVSLRTGFSPYTLMYGRDNVAMGYPEQRPIPKVTTEQDWFLRTKHCVDMYDQVSKENTRKYEVKLRGRLNKTARPVQFKEGEYVFYYDPVCAKNNTSKFSGKYLGPYRVEEAVADNRVQLKSLRTGKLIPHLININKLKRAYCEVSEEEEEPKNKEGEEERKESDIETEKEIEKGSREKSCNEEGNESKEDKEDSEDDGKGGLSREGSEEEEENTQSEQESEVEVKLVPTGIGCGRGPKRRCSTESQGRKPEQEEWDLLGKPKTPTDRVDTPVTLPTKQPRNKIPRESLERTYGNAAHFSSKGEVRSRKEKKHKGVGSEATKEVENEVNKEIENEGTETEEDEEEAQLRSEQILRSEKIVQKMAKRGRKQEKAMERWVDQGQYQESDTEERENLKKEKKISTKYRTEQQLWEIRKDREDIETQRRERRKERNERAIARREKRDKIAQKDAKAASEEEVSDEGAEERDIKEDRESKEVKKTRRAASDLSSSEGSS